MRLQRYLSQAGIASRRRAEQLIASGLVKVNGQVVTAAGVVVKERDRIEVEGKRVLRVDPIYRVLLKPRECLATLGVMGERQTLRRYLSNPEPGLAVVAPLDYPAEGVVLLTTDGELGAAIARRGQTVPMTYHLKLQGQVGETELARLTRGWRWENVEVRPLAVEALATTGKNTWIEIVVAEARPRALKAAGDIIRHSVLKISRVRLGSISFEGLKMGEWRDLSKGELGDLRQKAGITRTTGAHPPAAKPMSARTPDARPPGPRRADARPPGPRRPDARLPGPRRPDARPAGPRRPDARPAGPRRADARPAGPRRPDARPAGPRRPDARPPGARPRGSRPPGRRRD